VRGEGGRVGKEGGVEVWEEGGEGEGGGYRGRRTVLGG